MSPWVRVISFISVACSALAPNEVIGNLSDDPAQHPTEEEARAGPQTKGATEPVWAVGPWYQILRNTETGPACRRTARRWGAGTRTGLSELRALALCCGASVSLSQQKNLDRVMEAPTAQGTMLGALGAVFSGEA